MIRGLNYKQERTTLRKIVLVLTVFFSFYALNAQTTGTWSNVAGVWQATSSDGLVRVEASITGDIDSLSSETMDCSSETFSDPTIFGNSSLGLRVQNGTGTISFSFYDNITNAPVQILNPILHADKVGTYSTVVGATGVFDLSLGTWTELNINASDSFEASSTSFEADTGLLLGGIAGCSGGGSVQLNALTNSFTINTSFNPGILAANSDTVEFTLSNLVIDPCTYGAIVGVSTDEDPDGDGLNNSCDDDDDNDGILDVDEGVCMPVKSENWSVSGTTASYNYGNGVIANVTTTTSSNFLNGNFTTTATSFWSENLSNNTSLEASYDWGSTVTINFVDASNNPVEANKPIIHLDRIGGVASSVQNSALVTLLNGLTWSRVSGTYDFVTTATTVKDGGSTLPSGSGYTAESTQKDNNGSAAGTVRINEKVSSISLQFVQNGTGGTADSIEFIISACLDRDTDTDTVSDYIDLDSDNDGIFDVVEAGHNATHTNGRLTGAVGTDGIVNSIQSTGGENSGAVNYTLADSEAIPNGIPDYISLDADGDLCNDVLEAGYTDTNSDGILGDNPTSVNPDGVVIGATVTDGYTTPENKDSGTGNLIFDFQQPGQAPTIANSADQPQDVLTNGTNPETFTATATGNSLAYQWQVDDQSGSGFTDIDAANTTDIYTNSDTATLTLTGITATQDGYQYRVLIIDETFTCGELFSDSALLTFDNTPPSRPIVTIIEDSNNDGFINNTELIVPINVTINLPADAVENDVLTINGTPQTLSAADITAGVINTTFPNPGEGNTLTVIAFVSDGLGNVGVNHQDAAIISTILPAPTLIIDDVTADNTVNITEASGNITITGTVGGDFITGDTVNLTINSVLYQATIDNAGLFSISVSGSDLVADADTTIDGSFTTTDTAGNSTTTTATKLYNVDIIRPVTSFIIDDVTADNTVNATEASGNILITGTVSGDFTTGDTVTLLINGSTNQGTINNLGVFSISVPGSDLVNDSDTLINASFTTSDTAGNATTDTATKLYNVDVIAPAPTLIINDVTADNTVNAAEAAGNVIITGTVGGDFITGDTVTLLINSISSQGTIDNAGVFTITVSGFNLSSDADTTIDGSFITTDTAGNSTTIAATKLYNVDTVVPAPTLIINDVTADNIVNSAEASGTIVITGTVGGDFITGDTVTLLINGTISQGTIDNAGEFSITVSGSDLATDPDTTIEGSFTTTDTAGNSTSIAVIKSYNVNITGPLPTLTIDDVTADNIVNAAEASGNILITGTVGGDFNSGDTVTLVINGVSIQDTIDNLGVFNISFSGSDVVADADTIIDGSITTTDTGSNTTTISATKLYNVDVTAPAPTLTIDDVTTDNTVNAAEASGNVIITGTVGGEFINGDTVTLVINGVSTQGTIDNLGVFTITVSGFNLVNDADTTIDGSFMTTDAAGNSTIITAIKLYNVDTVAPAPTLTINDVTADNTVNAAEAAGNVIITGTVRGEFTTGDTVTLLINGVSTQGTIDNAGLFSITVSGSDLVDDADTTIDGSFTTTDAAGNTTTIATTKLYTLDLINPNAPVITSISDDTGRSSIDAITSDNTLFFNGTSEPNSTVQIFLDGISLGTVTTNGSGIFVFDHIGTVLSDKNDYILTAIATDVAGNTGSTSADFPFTVDTRNVFVPLVTAISDDTGVSAFDRITSDNTLIINGVSGGNDVVELFLDGTLISTVTANSSGQWIVDYTGITLADGDYILTARGTDLAGNISNMSSNLPFTIDTTNPLPPVFTAITDDTGIIGDQITSDNSLLFSGTSEANSVVEVFLDGTSLGSVTTNSSGVFSLDYTGTILIDGDYNLTGVATDLAGNGSTTSTNFPFTVDANDPIAPVITAITTDTGRSTTDGITSDTTLIISGTAEANSSVEIFLGGLSIGIVPSDNAGNWSLDYTGSPFADGNYILRARTTDTAGNESSVSSDYPIEIDTVDPNAPVITTISNDTGFDTADAITSDNTLIINGTSEANSLVEIFLDGTSLAIVTTNTSGNFSLDYTGTIIADGDYILTAISSDTAGNTSLTSSDFPITIDNSNPVATLVINDITADNIVNAAEAAGNITVTGTVSGDFTTGDTVSLLINGVTITGTVDNAGAFSIIFLGSDLAADTDTTVEGSILVSDAAGNTNTAVTTKLYNVDVTAPVPTLTIDDVTADNTVNETEASGNITITGTVGGDFTTGDTVTLIVNGVTTTGTIDAAGVFSIVVAGADLSSDADTTIDGSITTTDTAGNTNTVATTKLYNVDVTPPVPTLIINDVTADNIVNITEAAGNITITGTVGGDFTSGDNVTLVINGVSTTGPIDGVGAFSIIVSGADLASDADTTIDGSITTTDSAGNTNTVATTKLYNVDVTAPALTLIIDDVTADNTVNITEASGNITITGTVSGYFISGDTVTLVVNGVTTTGTIDTTGVFSISVSGNDLVVDADTIIEGSITTTDTAGNSTTTTTTKLYNVDVIAPVSTLTVNDVTADNTVNAAEASGNVTITGTVGGDFTTGDTVTLVINGVSTTGTIDATGVFSISVSGNDLALDADTTIEASVVTADAAENSTITSTTKLYNVDVIAPVSTLTVNDVTADNTVNAVEASGAITITGTVGGDFTTGDTVTLVINGISTTGTIDGGGLFSIVVSGNNLALDADSTIEGSITTVDVSGNSNTGTTTKLYNVDVTAPVPVLVINDITADNIINVTEAAGTVTITGTITGTISGDFTTGDTVTLVINGVSATGTIDAAGVFSIVVSGNDLASDVDTTVDGSITTTDTAGNSNTVTTAKLYTIDTTLPVPTITINDITADNTVNASEAAGTITVTGTVGGDFISGDTVTLVINGISTTGTVDTSGIFNIIVSGNDLASDVDTTVEGSVTTTDEAGNSNSTATTKNYNVEVSPVATPIISSISTDTNIPTDGITSDNTLTITGTSEADRSIEIFIDGVSIGTTTATTAGDWVFNYTNTVLADGTYVLTAIATDAFGNTSLPSSNFVVVIDTNGPTINDQLTDDLSPVITGEGEPNETLIVTIDVDNDGTPDIEYTVIVSPDGTWSLDTEIATPTSGSLPVLDYDTILNITVSDSAGNTNTSVITLDDDFDNDGLTNAEEEALGTDPNNADTDGDMVSDGQEVIENTNPLDDCDSEGGTPLETSDCDEDGLTNREEEDRGTDPEIADTDRDGILDGQEVADGTDPLDACDSNGGTPPIDVACDIRIDNDLITPDSNQALFNIINIEAFPENTVEVFNRWGAKVFGTSSYNNSSNAFIGLANGKAVLNVKEQLPAGTYFYVIKYLKKGEAKQKTGYLYINR